MKRVRSSKNEEFVPSETVIDLTCVDQGAKEVLKLIKPLWNLDNIGIKHFSEGITNKLFGCFQKDNPDDIVMFRIFGEKTELIIDRNAEKDTFLKLSKIGCSPPLYCVFKNGMAYGFVKGSPLLLKSVQDEKIYRQVAKEMVKLHTIDAHTNLTTNQKSYLYTKTENFIELLPPSFENPAQQERYLKFIPKKDELIAELELLRSHLDALNSPVVFCHNDLLLNNIIYDSETDKIGFIDYEYAFNNFQAFDIGDHFCEFAGVDEVDYNLYPKKEFQLKWLRAYLEYWFEATDRKPSDVTVTDVERLYVQVNKCALAAHLFWGIWGIIQAKNSTIDFDFLEYAQLRFGEYFKRKEEFLSLTLPDSLL
ncbi:hypothetical protein SNE40_003353 [Patella caerulea]|uniref:ethanolamine kinase n=1 Tax=Patella caerulea TaxID=87958 RepID=A0AAN8Q058_PATCE